MILLHNSTITCPKCGNINSEGFDYGTITDAPIAVQLTDLRAGIAREYNARRCYCPKCHELWDVVLVNKVK